MSAKLGESLLTYYTGPADPVFNDFLLKQEKTLQLTGPRLQSSLMAARKKDMSFLKDITEHIAIPEYDGYNFKSIREVGSLSLPKT